MRHEKLVEGIFLYNTRYSIAVYLGQGVRWYRTLMPTCLHNPTLPIENAATRVALNDITSCTI